MAVTLGKLSDRHGLKRTLIITTAILTVLLAIFPLVTKSVHVYAILPVIGIFWGGFYAISRALLTKLSPPERRSEFFSLYTIFRRFASVVGPLLWGITVLVLSPLGSGKYRVSIYPLIALMILGTFLIRKISETK